MKHKDHKIILPIHVLWFGNDYRKVVYTENEKEIEEISHMEHKIDLPNKDTMYMFPTRIRHYMTTEEMITKDQELWRKLNI